MRRLRFARNALAATLALALVGVAGASAQVTVKGDAQAWSEIKAAWGKLPKLKSYRVKITSAGVSATMSVVAADRFQVLMTYLGTTTDVVTVGRETRSREGNGPWQCGPPAGGAGAIMGAMTPANYLLLLKADAPGAPRGELTVVRGPAAAIDGVQTQSYTFSMNSTAQEGRERLYIETTSGLAKRSETLDEAGAVTETTTFFDYDATISITLPPCK